MSSFQNTGVFANESSPDTSSVSPGKSFVADIISSHRKQKRNTGRFSTQQRSQLEQMKLSASPTKTTDQEILDRVNQNLDILSLVAEEGNAFG